MKHRVGSIRITENIVFNEHDLFLESFEWLGFVTVHCERLYTKYFKYIGFSKRFDEIQEGLRSPDYDITATKTFDSFGIATYEFTLKRLED